LSLDLRRCDRPTCSSVGVSSGPGMLKGCPGRRLTTPCRRSLELARWCGDRAKPHLYQVGPDAPSWWSSSRPAGPTEQPRPWCSPWRGPSGPLRGTVPAAIGRLLRRVADAAVERPPVTSTRPIPWSPARPYLASRSSGEIRRRQRTCFCSDVYLRASSRLRASSDLARWQMDATASRRSRNRVAISSRLRYSK
jgi:hypothetical protein